MSPPSDDRLAFGTLLIDQTNSWLAQRPQLPRGPDGETSWQLFELDAAGSFPDVPRARWVIGLGGLRLDASGEQAVLLATQTFALFDEATLIDLRQFETVLGELPEALPRRPWAAIPPEAPAALVADLQHQAGDFVADPISASFSYPELVGCWMREGLPHAAPVALREPLEPLHPLDPSNLERFSQQVGHRITHGFTAGAAVLLLDTLEDALYLTETTGDGPIERIVWVADEQAGVYRCIDGDPRKVQLLSAWLAEALRRQGLDELVGEDDGEDWDDGSYRFHGPLSDWVRFQLRGVRLIDRRVQGEEVSPGGIAVAPGAVLPAVAAPRPYLDLLQKLAPAPG